MITETFAVFRSDIMKNIGSAFAIMLGLCVGAGAADVSMPTKVADHTSGCNSRLDVQSHAILVGNLAQRLDDGQRSDDRC